MDVLRYKELFEKYGGMMRTKDLNAEKVYYNNIQQLVTAGYI